MTVFKKPAPLALAIAAAIALPVLALSSAHAAFPEKPITVIVAWGAGGATDLVTRAVQPAFARALGTDVIIKNVTGASGTIGTALAARAKPDGYTVLFTPTGPITSQPHLRKIPYDVDSFAPVGRVAVTPVMMSSAPGSKIKTLDDVVAAAKANPGKLKFGSAGAGTLPHIAILALDQSRNIKTKHIPYKGSAKAIKAMLGGEVDLMSEQAQIIPKYELQPIASWSPKRLPEFPDTPTMMELGVNYTLVNWNGVLVPKDTPAEIIAILSKALKTALADPGVIAVMSNLKVPIAPMGPKEFGDFVKQDYQQNRDLLKQAGMLKK